MGSVNCSIGERRRKRGRERERKKEGERSVRGEIDPHIVSIRFQYSDSFYYSFIY